MLLFVFAMLGGVVAQTDTLTVRIKGMRCDECAHKVMKTVRELPGIESLRSNTERRTTTIVFDRTKTCADSIEARLAATGRYKASPYSPTDTIRRGMGLRIDDMHCQNCANKIVKRLEQIEGIDSLAPHLDKHYVFIRYDANRTCKDVIREVIGELGYTPVNYYSDPKVAFAYYNIPKEQATEETIDKLLVYSDAIDDANVNANKGSLAVTFFKNELSADQLLEAARQLGINAEVPAPHECKETMEQ